MEVAKVRRILSVLVAMGLGSALMGYAVATDAGEERLLTAAGFKKRPADTPEKLQHLEAMPQGKFFRQVKDGNIYYVYADAKGCRCLYLGQYDAWDRYYRLAQEARAGEDQELTGEVARDYVDWKVWGPFATGGE